MIKSPAMNETSLGFGFILLSLSFMPLFYSMQVLYLVRYKPTVTNVQWGAAIALQRMYRLPSLITYFYAC